MPASNLDRLRDALYLTYKDDARWTVFQCIENHDLLDFNHTGRDRQPRIAALADPSNARSWYARSRAKVATGLLLTAPGVPMIFMGQEFLEDKYWTDWPRRPELLIWWEGLERQGQAHVRPASLHARPHVAPATGIRRYAAKASTSFMSTTTTASSPFIVGCRVSGAMSSWSPA